MVVLDKNIKNKIKGKETFLQKNIKRSAYAMNWSLFASNSCYFRNPSEDV